MSTFELWCWRRLLGVPWTARRSNKSILKEISPEYLLEALMLKLQYFGHLMWQTDSLKKKPWWWERLKAGGEGDDGMRWLDGIMNSVEFEQAPGVADGQGGLVCCSPWGRKESDMTEWLNWTKLKKIYYFWELILLNNLKQFILVYMKIVIPAVWFLIVRERDWDRMSERQRKV